MDDSVSHKDRELQLLVVLFLFMPEMHSSVALECVACVSFLRKL